MSLNAGTSIASCSVGGNISVWFLTQQNATTFESASAVPARAPDAVIPLASTTLNATYKAQGLVQLPALNFKVLVQNNCGTTLGTSNTLVAAPAFVKWQ
jgi:hypothetical protein